MYGPLEDDGFSVPAVPYQQIDPQFLRQIVRDPTGEPAGSLVVDTSNHFLYLVRPNGYAIRYGVGSRPRRLRMGGRGVIQWKQKWPKWTPPAEMIARDPSLEKWSAENGGQPGGLKNPLGARALYIFHDGEDTLVSRAWLAGMEVDRQVGLVGLRAHDEPGRHRPLRPRTGQAPIIVIGNAGGELVATAALALPSTAACPRTRF